MSTTKVHVRKASSPPVRVWQTMPLDPKETAKHAGTRALGDYGRKLLDRINNGYSKVNAISNDWKQAFAEILAAFATIIGSRTANFGEASEGRKYDGSEPLYFK